MENLASKFLRTCEFFGNREAMRIKNPDGWEVYTYARLREQTLLAAGFLTAQGITAGDRVGLLLDNGPCWAIAYFAVILSKGIVVPLDPQANPEDISVFFEDAQVKLIFDAQTLEAAQKWKGPSSDERDLFGIKSDDTAALLYSSGTTASPKGIELTHRNFLSNIDGLIKVDLCSRDDVFVSVLPLFHAFAFTGTLLFPLCLGAKIVYPNTKKSQELLGIIQESGVTVMAGVPDVFKAIHKSIYDKLKGLPAPARGILEGLTEVACALRRITPWNPSKLLYRSLHQRFGPCLRFFVSGGAKLDEQVARDFERWGFVILEGYGLTETAPIVSLNLPTANKIGSVGRPIDGVEVRIESPKTASAPEAGTHENVGEIVIRGANVMKGYYKKPAETAEVIVDGWFRSGDLGLIDRDGFIYIRGRIKEVIVLGSGKNIFPGEIEAAYKRSLFIKEVGVFLSDNDQSQGLRAVIVPQLDEFHKKGLINVHEKIKWDIENISRELSAYKRIMGFVISKDELPKTRLGKIRRFQLEEIYDREKTQKLEPNVAESSTVKDPVIDSPLGKKVLEFLSNELCPGRVIRPSDHLELDLGIDSLTRVELVAGMEKVFQVRIPDDVLAKVATVADVIRQVTGLLADQDPALGEKGLLKISWAEILDESGRSGQFKELEISPGRLNRILAAVFQSMVLFLFKIFCSLRVCGKEHLPSGGPCILCCNHTSYLDAFAVIAAIPYRLAEQSYFIGSKEIFCHPSVRWAIKLAHLVPIDATGELTKALQSASYLLKQGKIICIFPEGQRSIDGEVKEFKKGVGILAKELDATLLPVAIDGTFGAWPRGVRWPRPFPVRVRFGQPLRAADIIAQSQGQEQKDIYTLITETVRAEVVRLKKM